MRGKVAKQIRALARRDITVMGEHMVISQRKKVTDTKNNTRSGLFITHKLGTYKDLCKCYKHFYIINKKLPL